MKLLNKYLPLLVTVALLFHFNKSEGRSKGFLLPNFKIVYCVDTPPVIPPNNPTDTTKAITLPYPFTDQSVDAPPLYMPDGGLRLSNPSNIKTDIIYNPQTGKYDIYQKIGDMDYRMPTEMDSDQFMEYMSQQGEHKYFQQKVQTTAKEQQKKGLIPPIHIGGTLFKDIFGSNTVNIRPQGSAELTFGFNNSKIENPALPVAQRSLTTFNFDENIQLNVVGEIGDKMKLSTSYNTKATFDFQNQMKLQFTGHEDDIIKSIDAGNVAFNLPGTLITGSQSLFGVKLKTQFGRLTSTTVYAQEKGNKKTITVQNGAQTSNFNIKVDQYQANQNFFLAQYFYNQYDNALKTPPIINSGVTITKIEVWITNTSSATQNTRDIVALSDLGESKSYLTHLPYTGRPVAIEPAFNSVKDTVMPPFDSINSLNPNYLESRYPAVSKPTTAVSGLISAGLTQVTDFEKIDLARMLSPSEFTLNSKLGYITLKQPLNYDQVLAVAYQYTINGQTYQVGQFSTDGVPTTNELVVKMLKSTNVSPTTPMWKLMMKNIYSLGSYQINSQNFMLQVWYSNPTTGVDIPYLPKGHLEGKLLLEDMGLDQLDINGDRSPDGIFDFINGVTIDAANGLVIFPSVQPFNTYLANKLTSVGDASLTPQFCFPALYDSVLVAAQQEPNLDRYWLRGSFQSSAGSDISLGAMNVPQGSVLVTAGGIKLTENVDYSVDYTLGRVKILNQGLLSSGTPIVISLENNALFSIQSKTYFGQHFDYMLSKNANLGATVVNYTEHPLTQIVSIGQEPVSNTMVGLNGDFKVQAPWLTDAIDKLPFIHTKAPSEITSSSEVAAMIPGHPKYIGSTGNAYLDNFEGSESFIDISQPYSWSIASIPQGQASMFPEANNIALDSSGTIEGFNRAKVCWYVVDPLFQQQTASTTPPGFSTDVMSDNFTRMVLQTEIFPNEQSPAGTPLNLPVLNVGFFPSMRGPYNYDTGSIYSAGLTVNGTLSKPTTRWGGIMRPIQETDFETDNIGFIEFWMMDPYNSDLTGDPSAASILQGGNSTGTLYFDLGDVSEDVLPDGLKSFENGLPTNATDAANPANVNNPYTTSHWGRIPVNPSLVNAFDNDVTSRPFQDVGLDGLSDADEQVFFAKYIAGVGRHLGTGSTDTAYTNALSDPSADDYHYYRGDDYDAANTNVLQRYMKYNGLEGNSPTQATYGSENPNGGNYPTTESTLPNTEDINQDNTLSTDETYYEYQVKMDPRDVNSTNVGNNYITNAYMATSATLPNGNTKKVWWYQFKIPISSFIRKVGPIADFKSIRFIRMYFKGFDKPVMLRFAKLELVRDDWRKFDGSLLAPGEYIPADINTTFNMYGVNLEENASRTPVSYVIPPGIQRQLNLQSANLVQMNEGSLALQLCNLQDGDARGVYKNVQLDLRAYKDMNMFIHCESADPAHPLKQGDVTAFIRLGSDFTNNYYEYEIPLQVTPPGSYNTNNANDQTTVWPTNNQMDIQLSKLESAKLARDAAVGNNTLGYELPYTVKDGNNNITVVGNPTISNLQVIMLGVRNPKRIPATATTDDGQPKCTEVWFDELRMTNFSEKGGIAAITRATVKLADWGTLSLAGNLSTPGFGSLETTVGNLSRETDEGFNIATNLEMGRLLPPKWNVSVPMYAGYGEQIVIPEYNPLDPDILLKDALNTLPKEAADSLRNEAIGITKTKSLNFTNVHKNKGKNAKKSHFYDIENLSALYAFTEQDKKDINTDHSITRTYKGGLTYNYSFHPKPIQPLIKSDFFKKSKYLALIRDFNFYPMPDKLSVSANVDRMYNEFELRNNIPGIDFQLPTSVSKTFNVLRNYSLTFPITKSLKFEYIATNGSRIDEPPGVPITTSQQKDSVWRNYFLNRQETTDFNQKMNINYDVPINKIPILDFVTVNARYSSSYQWLHAPFAEESLGATIQNSNTKSLNGQLNMTMFYNKIPFLKKFLQEQKGNQKGPQPPGKGVGPMNKNQQQQQQPDKADTAKKPASFYAGKWFVYLLTSVKNVSFTYSNTQGIVLPGFRYTPSFFGMDNIDSWAPGPSFVFGGRQKGIPATLDGNTYTVPIFVQDVFNNRLLTTNDSIFTPLSTINTTTYSGHVTLEPIPDFKIELTATHTFAKNTSMYVHDSLLANGTDHYVINTYTESGNFSMTYFMLPTIFEGNTASDTRLFYTFLDYRSIISTRLGSAKGSGSSGPLGGYYDGYGPLSQQVVIPAFLAAYSGESADRVNLNPFPSIPFPNWNITYSGLSKLIPWVKKNTQTVTISSAYTSTYTMGGYNYNLLYNLNPDLPPTRDNSGDFLPLDQIPTVTLDEHFDPLIKIGVTLKSNIMSTVEVRHDRQIALNMSDLSVNEVHGNEYIAGIGYKIKGVPLPIKIGNKPLKNDVTIKLDFSYRINQTILRNSENLSNQVTGGTSILSIKPQAEYNVNQRVTFRLFFDKIINNPLISSSYPTSTMDGGIAIRFTLS